MSFLVLPPEINSLRMFLGAGSAPMLQAAGAWNGLAAELGSAADSFSSVTSGLTGQAWQGPASAAMSAAAAPYAGFLSAASARAAGAACQANAVASAFEAAQQATIHPLQVSANRNAFVQAIRANLFGFNAPAIMAFESQYEEMWAQDVAAMVGYHGGASAAAAQLSSWQQTLQGLPGIGQIFGAPAAATAAASGLPNIGVGDKGTGNIGNGNNGTAFTPDGGGNVGNGNTGSSNLGSGNRGNLNIGSGNNGIGNTGFGNAGTGATNPGGNVGFGNTGSRNLGFGNGGAYNTGFGNSGGNGNQGFGNSGSSNTGGRNAGLWKHRLRQHRQPTTSGSA